MTQFPAEFTERLEKIYTSSELEIINKGFQTEKRKTCIRVNTLKSTNQTIEKALEENGITFKKVDFLKNGYILENATEIELWELEIYKKGHIYLQSISSQLPADLLKVSDFDTVLDVTAAPGGKTSQVSALLKNTWKIVANDNNSIRIDKLNTTLKKQGCHNVEVIKNDARTILEKFPEVKESFVHIIADLPCSAEGKFNTHKEKSFGYWDMGVVKRNFKLQKQIIKSMVDLLKDNGTLLYSTCTLAPEENEEIVHMMLSCYPELSLEPIVLEGEYFKPGLTEFNGKTYRKTLTNTLRVLPSEETEGFYIAKFRKQKIED